MSKKSVKKDEKSVVCRIPMNIHKEIISRGKGDFRNGIVKTNILCKEVEKNPVNIIMQDVDNLMAHIEQYYPMNHYNHFSNFPAFMKVFLRTGKPPSSKMLNKVFEKQEKKVIK